MYTMDWAIDAPCLHRSVARILRSRQPNGTTHLPRCTLRLCFPGQSDLRGRSLHFLRCERNRAHCIDAIVIPRCCTAAPVTSTPVDLHLSLRDRSVSEFRLCRHRTESAQDALRSSQHASKFFHWLCGLRSLPESRPHFVTVFFSYVRIFLADDRSSRRSCTSSKRISCQ